MPMASPLKPDSSKETAILESAVNVFAREGFRGADVQGIADAAGVGKGTVYRYFGDKQDLFWATVYWVLGKQDQFLGEAIDAAEGPLEKLRASCAAYGQFFQQHPQYLELLVLDRAEFRGQAPEVHLELHEQMIQRFQDIVETGIAAGLIRPLDARRIVIGLGSTLHGAVVFAAYAKTEQTLTEASTFVGDVFLRGIHAPQDAQE